MAGVGACANVYRSRRWHVGAPRRARVTPGGHVPGRARLPTPPTHLLRVLRPSPACHFHSRHFIIQKRIVIAFTFEKTNML